MSAHDALWEFYSQLKKRHKTNAQKFLQCQKNIVTVNLMLLLYVVGFETVLFMDLHKIKVIIDKSRDELSLLEQDTIENVS